MKLEPREYPNGLTVRELKALIADWPEVDESGEETEVWIETGFAVSSPVTQVWPLNSFSIILESDAFPEPNPDTVIVGHAGDRPILVLKPPA